MESLNAGNFFLSQLYYKLGRSVMVKGKIRCVETVEKCKIFQACDWSKAIHMK